MKPILRRLARSPMFTVITLVTLAIGIGANTAIFSVLNGVLLKPLPYPDPDRLVGVWETAHLQGMQQVNASPATYFTFREESRTFQDIGIWRNDSVNITGTGEPEQVDALDVTDGVLPILGAQPIRGRWFTRKDDSPGSPKTVILSLRLLAAQIRRRSIRHRTAHHGRWRGRRDHRHPAGGLPLHELPAPPSSRRCNSTAPKSSSAISATRPSRVSNPESRWPRPMPMSRACSP
jgi:hypothetical protein